MKLSIIIPMYNEEKTISELIVKVEKAKIDLAKEIIVINDGSTDGSLRSLCKFKNIDIISFKENTGKGFAIRAGLKRATGDIILIQDADLEYSPSDYDKLIDPILGRKAKIVFGKRFHSVSFFCLSGFGNALVSRLFSYLAKKKVSDVEVGYKLFTKDLKDKLILDVDDFGVEIEMAYKLLAMGEDIYEVPISYSPRTKGKKLNFIDGLKAFYYVIKLRNKTG
jgi:glycosyltransferase involved in cell wall biosynthesis